jgi:hypothetical protein
LILVLSATLLSALIPAFLTFRRDMFENLRTGGQGATLTRGGHRMRGALVVSQVGAATVLLFACALAIRSLGALLTVDTGFEAQAVWRFSATTPSTRYADADQIQTFQQQMLGRLRAIPGVVNASAAYAPPMENVSTTSVVLEGTVEPSPEIGYNAADGDYFQTLGIPLLAGRLMNIGDVNSGPAVAVVNRTVGDRPARSDKHGRQRGGGRGDRCGWRHQAPAHRGAARRRDVLRVDAGHHAVAGLPRSPGTRRPAASRDDPVDRA